MSARAALLLALPLACGCVSVTWEYIDTDSPPEPGVISVLQPGEADLTAHVDFAELGCTAVKNGLRVHGPICQAKFLNALGLRERCARLMEKASEKNRELIASGAKRLADAAQMGEHFKVMALTGEGLTPPPFAECLEPEVSA